MRLAPGAMVALALLAGCGGEQRSGEEPEGGGGAGAAAALSTGEFTFPVAPDVPVGSLAPDVEAALSELLGSAASGGSDPDALETIADSDDARLGWIISDLLRFARDAEAEAALVGAFERLSAVDLREDPEFDEGSWLSLTNHMIAWDLPAPPAYRERKAELFLALEPRWKSFFADTDSAIDWRLISWGGVLIDDRRPGDPEPCPTGCIPALDDPALSPASGGDWYPDDRLVFGVVVGGQAVAFPKNIMEVHEMVNITIGGRRLGIPYCTLCGSAQAYLLDAVPPGVEPPVLRTSGLLSRSNKVMYDLRTRSVLDTFTGRALSGALLDRNVALKQVTVAAATWGEWKRAHPGTMIVAQDGGIGRRYPDDPLGGRDDDGPIFPIGDVDPRLPVHAQVLGVVSPRGQALAFDVERARATLAAGGTVRLRGVEVVAGDGGLRARAVGGPQIPAHQAFWFAWSQFHPDSAVWAAPS